MSDDWNSVTRIGSKVRSGGGTVTDRERVVKGKSALNAAQRSGAIIGTEKKYGSTNSGGQGEGQRLTKVDRSDDIVKVTTVGKEVGDAIRDNRNKKGMKQPELATKCNITPNVLQTYENGSAKPDQKILGALERNLGVKLRGSDIGQPKFPKKS